MDEKVQMRKFEVRVGFLSELVVITAEYFSVADRMLRFWTDGKLVATYPEGIWLEVKEV